MPLKNILLRSTMSLNDNRLTCMAPVSASKSAGVSLHSSRMTLGKAKGHIGEIKGLKLRYGDYRNQVGIGLSYRPAGLCSLATQFQTRFLKSIPHPIEGLKFSTLIKFREVLKPRSRVIFIWPSVRSRQTLSDRSILPFTVITKMTSKLTQNGVNRMKSGLQAKVLL
jgi:hypothetical protein